MRKAIFLFIVGTVAVSSLSFSQPGTILQYPYLYKSPRAMGMGGAYIAVGGATDAVFYNPAGLSRMPSGNWEVNLIGLSASLSENALDLRKDMEDALNTGDLDGDGDSGDDQVRAVNDVLKKYRGENFHLELADWTSVGRNQDSWAFTFGGIARARADAMPHQGLGSEGILEVNADVTYGGVLGLSLKVTDGLYAGVGAKLLNREALVHNFSAREIVENQDNLEDYITSELRKSGSAVGIDAGFLYQFAQNSWLRPSVGVSVMDIGDTDFKDAGKIPTTLNVGVAVSPKIPVFHSLTLAADYVDLLNNYEEDEDRVKRLRLGGELYLIKNSWLSFALRAGLYQGYPTVGAELELALIRLTYVSYAEEVGAYGGQKEDRRHLLMLNIGW